VGDANGRDNRGLVLLVDDDVESRRHVRRLLELHGMDVVQASNGIAALELIQRLPQSFRLVITELDLPGLSGVMLAETLRLFRPDLLTLCMSGRAVAGSAVGRQCLSKPVEGAALQAAMLDAHLIQESDNLPEAWVARARARYAMGGDLVEAALELSRAAGTENRG
jgi:CheY-like chemotaxis protein